MKIIAQTSELFGHKRSAERVVSAVKMEPGLDGICRPDYVVTFLGAGPKDEAIYLVATREELLDLQTRIGGRLRDLDAAARQEVDSETASAEGTAA